MTVPIKQNTAGQFDYILLFDGVDIVTGPTIAAIDFRISIDDGALAPLATLPVESPAGSGWVLIAFSQAETNGAVIKVRWIDDAGAEWDDGGATWRTSVRTVDDLAYADEVYEGALTLRNIIRILLAALAGKSTGGGTASVQFRDVADSKDRIDATVTVNGNRTAVTLDGS